MKKIAILFPGQGPQYPGMGKMFHDQSEKVRIAYSEASDILGYDLAKQSFEGSFDEITDTRYAQPALIVASFAGFQYYVDVMGKAAYPSFFAGHSMGEVTALLASGVFSFEDAVRIAKKRGELMHEMTSTKGGTMAAVKDFDWKRTEEICAQVSTEKEHVSIASYNTDKQTVITGTDSGVSKAGEICAEQGGIFVPLNISVGSHCPIMNDIIEEYRNFVKSCKINAPQGIVYSCMTGLPYKSKVEIEEHFVMQLVNPVYWNHILNHMAKNDAGIFIEAGPGSALGKFMKRQNGMVISVEKTPKEKLEEIFGKQIKSVPTPLTKSMALAISIPNQNNDHNEYQDFVKKYSEIKRLQENVEREERLPNNQEIDQAVDMLAVALQVKQTSVELRDIVASEFADSFPEVDRIYKLSGLKNKV